MKCSRSDDQSGVRLSLEGTFDAATLAVVRPIFDEVVAQKPQRVVVDLAGVPLIDSSGIGAMLALCKRVRADGGDVCISGVVQEQPLMVIKLLKLEAFFRMT